MRINHLHLLALLHGARVLIHLSQFLTHKALPCGTDVAECLKEHPVAYVLLVSPKRLHLHLVHRQLCCGLHTIALGGGKQVFEVGSCAKLEPQRVGYVGD